MEWVALVILAVILAMACLTFMLFLQFRETARETRRLQERIMMEVSELTKKINELAKSSPSPAP
jgi:flagellar basal body-associated protein FliL